MAKFEYRYTPMGWFFRLVGNRGERLLYADMVPTLEECLESIKAIREYAADPISYERQQTHSGYYNFIFSAGSRVCIGHSDMFTTAAERDAVLEKVMHYAAAAELQQL